MDYIIRETSSEYYTSDYMDVEDSADEANKVKFIDTESKCYFLFK